MGTSRPYCYEELNAFESIIKVGRERQREKNKKQEWKPRIMA